MKKKVFAVLGACVLLTATAYAQRPLKMAKQSFDAMTGGVPSAFSTRVPVTVLSADVVGNVVRRAQFATANQMYLSSAELFKRVQANEALKALPAETVRLLETKFGRLDEIVKLKSTSFNGYRGALLSERPMLKQKVFLDPQVNSMLNVLDIQHYMQVNNNEFPQLFAPMKNGWKTTAKGLDTADGNSAFFKVLDILVQQQAGKVSPAIVNQLVMLRSAACNRPSIDALVKSLGDWHEAFPNAGDPKLPTEIENVNVWREAEKLWLVTEIRLLQLTPGIELPEVLKNAVVTQ